MKTVDPLQRRLFQIFGVFTVLIILVGIIGKDEPVVLSIDEPKIAN